MDDRTIDCGNDFEVGIQHDEFFLDCTHCCATGVEDIETLTLIVDMLTEHLATKKQ